ncbi:MAG: dTDP-4-dehydrorhamnose reductase [Thermoprotei archaeon]|jgi:dTDP-4-dehydrorhamnose reductase
MVRLLVVGGSGLLGSKVMDVAARRGFVVYSSYFSHKTDFSGGLKLDVTDFSMVKDIIRRVNPDVVIHASAVTDVDLCEKNRELAYKVNVLGTGNVVKACESIGAYLVYISTDYVFSGDKGFYKEDDEPNPINYYGYTKLEGERLVMSSNLKYLIVRTSVIYGAKPAAGKINFALWIIEKLKNNEYVKVLTDQFISPTLNTNLAEMILEAVEKDLNGVYHMAGDERVSRYDFALKIAEIFNLNPKLVIKASMNDMNWIAKRPKDSSLNVEKTKSILNTKPLKLDEAIKKLKLEVERI